jgi:ribosome-associated protein
MSEGSGSGREGRGREAKKRAARAFDALAAQMVEASDAQCERFPLSDDLRQELVLARRITARGGRKRQLKRLAGLLRRDESTAEGVRAVLAASWRADRTEREDFHRLESMRDALCDPTRFAEAIRAAAQDLPDLDTEVLTRLARQVHRSGDKKASREIFRRLRSLMEAHHAK